MPPWSERRGSVCGTAIHGPVPSPEPASNIVLRRSPDAAQNWVLFLWFCVSFFLGSLAHFGGTHPLLTEKGWVFTQILCLKIPLFSHTTDTLGIEF